MKKQKWLMLFLAGAGACLISFLFAKTFRSPAATGIVRLPSSPRVQQLIPNLRRPSQERLVYPYSVIPGGVRSREELATSISNDQVVATHFADFAVSRSRIVGAEETKNVHVSYRIRDKVYWTAKTVKIPKGESLISDGSNLARTRCGNRISVMPQAPTSEEEPDVSSFEVAMLEPYEPQLDLLPESRLVLAENPPIAQYFPVQPPAVLPYINPYYYFPPFVVRPPDEFAVPEPGTFGLLLAGLAVFCTVVLVRKK